MRTKLDYQMIESLLKEEKSYKEIVEITGYNKNSVYGYCLRNHGKLADRNKSRRQSIPLTQELKEYMFGTLMGDGNLQVIGERVMGRTNHSWKQENYCKYKLSLFNNLSYPVKEHFVEASNKRYKLYYYCLKPNTELLDLYNKFYLNNKKDVPYDLSLLTPRAMALWFMDDGTASGRCSISIATCSFSIDGLLRLKEFLKLLYDLDITIQKDFKIYFSADSARKFYNLVKDYIIEDMLYKFKYIRPSAGLKLR